MKRYIKTVEVGGHALSFETGKIARQANGSVLVHQGETVVFCAACASPAPAEAVDFLPLRVDYQENFSAAGKTLGGFIKRQGRPTEREVLVSRLIDRPLRPLFENGYYNEVQLLAYVWSYDGVHSPEPLAICAASAALCISDIPLKKPVAGVRVGLVGGQFIVNPTLQQQKNSKLDLFLAGTKDAILMIEGYCDFLTEEQVIAAIEFGHLSIRDICKAIAEWQEELGKPKNRATLRVTPATVIQAVEIIAGPLVEEALRIPEKTKREEALSSVDIQVKASLEEKEQGLEKEKIAAVLKEVRAKYMRKMIVEENMRSDGRKPHEIRLIDIEISVLPRTHGSALFTRGETQSLAVCTLGGESMAQRFEDLEGERSNAFYLHYFFPPFSVGEVGRIGAPGRREVGHGKLAERALMAVLPGKEDFPYSIRVESNITESNGSSSMASVCGGCLALMDAGVPIARPIAGIAMGLILEEGRYTILSDILGMEDALGDMDFKVAGDSQGITALQMDIKIEGITTEILVAALAQAKVGRIHILNKMLDICPSYRAHLSAYAPRMETVRIKPSKIAAVIGRGGEQIRSIIEQTGVEIDIQDDGTVTLAAASLANIEKAKAIINELTAEVEIGRVYRGKIKSVVPFGVFVEILPGKEGLCHISEFDQGHIATMEEHAKVGDMIDVLLMDINQRGQLKLSRKATFSSAAAAVNGGG